MSTGAVAEFQFSEQHKETLNTSSDSINFEDTLWPDSCLSRGKQRAGSSGGGREAWTVKHRKAPPAGRMMLFQCHSRTCPISANATLLRAAGEIPDTHLQGKRSACVNLACTAHDKEQGEARSLTSAYYLGGSPPNFRRRLPWL